jgi:hypothetical protein
MKKIYLLFLLSVVYLLSNGQVFNPQNLPYASYKEGFQGPALKSSTVPGHFAKQALANDAECKIDALLLAADDVSYVTDVQTYLMNTGMFNLVDTEINSTPTLETLRNYDAILVWADNSLDDTVGDTLAAYIDEGGGVVSAVFNLFTGWGIEGTRFNTDYLLLNLGNFASGATTTLGTVYDANHPIMEGVTSLTNPNEYRSNNATMTTGSEVIAEWSDGLPLVVVKENLGPANARRADINIFPPSSTIRGDFWDASTDGDIILANALLWVSKTCDCADVVVDNDPGICSAVVNYTEPTAEGATVTQIDESGLTSGDEFPVGTTIQQYEFDFGGGDLDTCTFNVIVNDTEPPVIDCPENIVVSNDPGECGAVVSYGNITFSGEEKLVDEVLPGSLSQWTVNDTGGNPAFTYTEIESPYDGSTAIKTSVVGVTVSQCPSQNIENTYNISGNTDETKLKAYLAFTSTMDTYNFPYVVVYLFDSEDNQVGFQIYYGKGVISGIFAGYASADPDNYTELSDSSGDMILDLSKMGSDIDFNKIKIVLANYACIGQNSIIFDHLRVINGSFDSGTGTTLTASDNCPGVLVEASIPSGSFFPVGTTPVTLTATDAAGNMTSCTFNVTVEDTEAPVAVCGSGGTDKNVLLLWDTDNANTQSLKTAIEAAGFTVTLTAVPEYQWDGTNPSLDGFDAVIHLNGTTYSSGMPLSAQNALLDFVQVQGKLFVHSEWDAHGIDVMGHNPALAPIVILQRNSGYETAITYSTIPGYETHPVLDGIPSSFVIDFAGHNMGQVRQYGTYPAETMMIDHGGNAAVAIRELEIGRVVGFGHAGNYNNSNSLSNANVQKLFINALKWGTNFTGDFEFVLDENGTVTITPEDIDQGSTDNCGIESMELSQTEFTWSDIGTQEVIFTVTDLAGNSSSCIANITIAGGNQEPVVVANPIDVYLDETGRYVLTRDDVEKMAEGTTDDTTPFEDLMLSAYPHIFTCEQVFDEVIHTRLTVEDAEGNIARAWTTVTVHDTLPPAFVPVNDIEIVLEPGLG